MTLITGPSEEAIKAGDAKKELAERYVIRKMFWTGLLEKSRQKTKLHAGISAGQHNWIGSSVGMPSGLSLNYAVRRHDAQVELYIDADKNTGEGNKSILDQLMSHREEIERTFGAPLDWQSLKGKRACRINKNIPIAGWRDEEKWPEAHEAIVDAMIALEGALRPHLEHIQYTNGND